MRLSVRTLVNMDNFAVNPDSDPLIILITKDIFVRSARAYVLNNARAQLRTASLAFGVSCVHTLWRLTVWQSRASWIVVAGKWGTHVRINSGRSKGRLRQNQFGQESNRTFCTGRIYGRAS